MVYLNLSHTPNSDLVDPVAALNNKWDLIDSKFAAMDSGASPVGTGVTNPEQSMEFVGSGLATPDIKVYDGAAYNGISTVETFGSWTNITLATNFNAVASRTPALRVSNLGRVQTRGAVQYQTGTTAWPTGYNTVNSNQFVSSTWAPSVECIRNTCAGPITGTTATSWAYGQVQVTIVTGFLVINMFYQGAIAGSGNYLDLSGLGWFVG